PVALSHEILNGQLRDEGVDVQVSGQARFEIGLRSIVDALHEIPYRHVEIRDRLELVRLGREPRYVPPRRAGVLKAPVVVLQVVELVEITGVLAETGAQERRRHLFGDRVNTNIFAAGAREQP